ncbi:CyP450 monooxygenase [Coniophora puteana RWD-64-598 SS2]|uniref:CyP450 monooxygenase n=1 Tax=Coniophora puteana (strain RWD-64-598) TaxID=741705 RepID=A0A5M3MYH3_CONPW|nr:CyP450 monooxygenase [Coniophora puteana RWD-64-598 SS2]EIW83661.1 CyP450 monooxygenase [Coniophora puteana RWD-64-598 SS2]
MPVLGYSVSLRVIGSVMAAAILVIARRYLRKRRANPAGLPLPPGPPRLPLVGTLGINIGAPWLTYAEWGKTFGDLIYLEILGMRLLVINSDAIAKELLDKRAATYSDRPQVPMVTLMGWEFNVGFYNYNDHWRKHRRAMHNVLKPDSIRSYRHLQTAKVHVLLRNLLCAPERMEAHLRTFTASTIMIVLYGYEIAPQGDRFAEIADTASEMLTNSFFPGAALVNALPFLRHLPSWFPGAGFKRYANICRAMTREMRDAPYDFVKKNSADGTGQHCIVQEMIENGEEVDVIKSVAGTSYAAAVETSSSAMSAFMMAMVLFPEVQAKAQAELDCVTGGERLPTWEDRESLVYIEALYREVLRWCQVTPLGVPHLTKEDDVYDGYFIPKDTFVFTNIWAMTHDPRVYPEPMRFMPERFLTQDGKALTDDTAQQQFGYGRRICVGKFLAEAAIWITIVNVLACFKLAKAKDEKGKDIDFEPEWTPGVIIHPKEYPFHVAPRSPHAAELVQMTEG